MAVSFELHLWTLLWSAVFTWIFMGSHNLSISNILASSQTACILLFSVLVNGAAIQPGTYLGILGISLLTQSPPIQPRVPPYHYHWNVPGLWSFFFFFFFRNHHASTTLKYWNVYGTSFSLIYSLLNLQTYWSSTPHPQKKKKLILSLSALKYFLQWSFRNFGIAKLLGPGFQCLT